MRPPSSFSHQKFPLHLNTAKTRNGPASANRKLHRPLNKIYLLLATLLIRRPSFRPTVGFNTIQERPVTRYSALWPVCINYMLGR
ncbi:hypothetical protein CGMCC3_g15514 [Colletotrichum fructicola]|nr:uncharacterized protein CGMCC3_g15514 [Colletotrichum fructicola]KAE9568387.1 hypothetical protein CGMCC3_g15514 [Colletotrichum fructicola]